MKKSVVLVGLGEIGGVFARALLKTGHIVVPVLCGSNWEEIRVEYPEPQCVIVAVRENNLSEVLSKMPGRWKDKTVLVQNELLPSAWKMHGIINPTVISVWFEKKQPNDFKVIIPSPIYGPNAQCIYSALKALGIASTIVLSEEELLFELVLKNVYILTTNITGLKVGGTVGQLWDEHKQLAREVAEEVMDIQFAVIGKELDREKLIQAMVHAFKGDKAHKCMGRSAQPRLERALKQADEFELKVNCLRGIKRGL